MTDIKYILFTEENDSSINIAKVYISSGNDWRESLSKCLYDSINKYYTVDTYIEVKNKDENDQEYVEIWCNTDGEHTDNIISVNKNNPVVELFGELTANGVKFDNFLLFYKMYGNIYDQSFTLETTDIYLNREGNLITERLSSNVYDFTLLPEFCENLKIISKYK